MDFSLDDEQRMLKDSLRRFLEREYSMATRRALAATPLGHSQDNWTALAEMGLLALNVPEEAGGLGAGSVETMLVMEELGRHLVVEPFLASAVIGAAALASVADAAMRDDLLGRLAAGDLKLALAAHEPEARFDIARVAATATEANGTWMLTGRKCVVINGDSADKLVVPARTAGNVDDETGITLFLVDTKAAGLTIRGFPNMDGTRSAEIELAGVRAEAVIGEAGDGFALLEHLADRAIAALCGEAVGVMERALEMTASYLNERKQFGQPLAKFQVLQHRIADMFSALEQVRAAALMATAGVELEDRGARRRAVSNAKVIVGEAGRSLGEAAIQLHGGMGMTDEMDIGYYFKRLRCIDVSFGDSGHHLELYARAMEPA